MNLAVGIVLMWLGALLLSIALRGNIAGHTPQAVFDAALSSIKGPASAS